MILAFTDCETTHLSPEFGEVWEVAVIRREHDGSEHEYVWQFAPRTLDVHIHGEALTVGRYHERYAIEHGYDAAFTARDRVSPMTRKQAAEDLAAVLRGAVLVGSNPGFDDRHLRKLLGVLDEQPWHYRPVCIANLAEGYLWAHDPEFMAKGAAFPPSSKWLSRQMGVDPPAPDVAHTALGDARWAKAVYDAVTGGKAGA